MNLSLDGKQIGGVQLGIPVPIRPGGKASPERRAIEEMDADESRTFTGYKSRHLVQTCASIRKKFPERRYTVRSMGENGLVVRVWRTG
jgi:hypothetical protein